MSCKSRHYFTEQEKQFIKANCYGKSEKDFIQMFFKAFGIELSLTQFGNFKAKYKLKSGTIGGQFKKGQTAFNKGKKWADYMSQEGQTSSKKTQFKKGNVNHNRTSVGTERLSKDGYVEIRMPYGKKQKNGYKQYYQLKHRVIWEQANGKVPPGHALIFADGNKTNFNLDNLLLISRAELARLNQNKLIFKNADLTKSGVMVAKLINQIGKIKNKTK